jgi:2-keto-4-pentenoate hydratase/2-oxohepta-3-ene-1,7-dioic acid hydratase in catechol pathway
MYSLKYKGGEFMRYVRFWKDKIHWGIINEGLVKVLDGDFLQGGKATGEELMLEGLELLAPVQPGKIVCVGLNYIDHAKEMNLSVPEEPILFLKPPSATLQHKGNIEYPSISSRVDFEAELAIVIGKQARLISEHQAEECIFGYTCANDVTARDLQQKDGQWTRAKSFDTFLPLGPWIETELNPEELEVELRLNGEIKQKSNTRNFIFPVNYMVSFISQVMTLEPGDVIITGTPPGVGAMEQGDEVTVWIQGIGELKNFVGIGLFNEK